MELIFNDMQLAILHEGRKLEMCEIDVWCQNEDCGETNLYRCNWEDAADGSEHQMTCPHCQAVTVFEIDYSPIAGHERLAGA